MKNSSAHMYLYKFELQQLNKNLYFILEPHRSAIQGEAKYFLKCVTRSIFRCKTYTNIIISNKYYGYIII